MRAHASLWLPFLAVARASLASDCPAGEGLCLSSFKWCSADDKSCATPENADLNHVPPISQHTAVLYYGSEYNISWQWAQENAPVLVQWIYGPLSLVEEHTNLEVLWSTNVTGNLFTFNPWDIIKTFPTSDSPNITMLEAYSATQWLSNQIWISQPEVNDADPKSNPSMQSDFFAVQDAWVSEFVQTVREVERKAQRRWQVGVGAGVSLGAPILVLATWFLTKRSAASSKTI